MEDVEGIGLVCAHLVANVIGEGFRCCTARVGCVRNGR